MTSVSRPISEHSVQALLRRAASQLAATSVSARLDAELLLSHVLGDSRSRLYAESQRQLTTGELDDYERLLRRRRAGEPVAYITGVREFWSLALRVSPATLVPRPETELLVEQALRHCPPDGRCADLGTGSGAIAIALACERADLDLIATDSSAAALAVARLNAESLFPRRITFSRGDWCAALNAGTLDVIVSNPPYIAAGDPALEADGVRCEPRAALAAGTDGLAALRHIVATAPGHLRRGGWLLLEHGADQADSVGELFVQHGYRRPATYHDNTDRARVAAAQWPGAQA